MAIAKCGQHWSWDSPMWCSGKKLEGVNYNVNRPVETICITCPWYKGNNKYPEYYEQYY